MFAQALAGRGQPAGDVRLLPRLDHQRRHAGRPLPVPRRRARCRSRASGGWRRRSTTPARWCKAAAKGGREVILGGHSLGASLTAAYAAWDFNGKPGYKDVDGLVLIDGGLLGSFDAYDLAQAQQQIADLADVEPVHRPARDRDPRGGRPVRRGRRRSTRASTRRRRRRRSRTSRCCPAAFKPRVPGHQPGAARLRLRPRHLAGRARPAARQRRAARREPATRATGPTAGSPRSPGSPRPSARSR